MERILNNLLSLSAENEVVEFKEAKNQFNKNTLGEYFSALANEANLKGVKHAWLVFGIKNDKSIVGTSINEKQLNEYKAEMVRHTSPRCNFIDVHRMEVQGKNVLMFEIPAAPQGQPVSWKGHRYGRDGESLGALSDIEYDRIKSQVIPDWSAQIVEGASIDDLDGEAIAKARENFKNKFPDKVSDVEQWDDMTFLNKAKLTIKGKITRTAIVLLGKEEAEHFVSPSELKIRWILKDGSNNEKDYAIETCPFLLAVDKIYQRIRNLKYRYIKDGSLFPDEIDQYEPYIIREALNNCIAHQDYTKEGRINVIEMEDSQLIFTNLGDFIPGSVERVVEEDAPEEHYRNKFLATAMFNLKMVDTAGGGIKKMFNYQKMRFFPLPEYDLSDGRVKATITGKILDMEYARLLASSPNLSLPDIIMLDKVQKQKKLTVEEEKYLKSKGFIEGRKPNFYISKKIAQSIGKKADYSKNKGLDKQWYLDLIKKSIQEHKQLNRSDIDNLLWNKLPDYMTEQQKKVKINNLLSELRKKDEIKNIGTFHNPKWVLINQRE